MVASDEQLRSELILDHLKRRQRSEEVVDIEAGAR